MNTNGTRLVSEIVFRSDLYPRIKHSPETVQKYAEDLSVLPPIEINQHNELIDGWHRWTAHKKAEAENISTVVIQTASDSELLELAIERNASHGLQLSQEDKRDMARRIYNATPEKERDGKKAHLATILSIGLSTIHAWLSNIDADAKAARNRRIFDAWLRCETQEEIAEKENLTSQGVGQILKEFPDLEKLSKSARSTAEHAIDFETPLYTVWTKNSKTSELTHFGNTETRWVDNLLYLYTKPFDVVIDPFAGSGSTIDICKKRLRRYWVGDRLPVVERESEIRKWDVTEAWPRLPWKDVRLVYLDPPYWKQAEGKYSEDPTDLANMPLEAFTETLLNTIKTFAQKLTQGYIALVIQPTQWNAPERQFTDHIADVLRAIKLPINIRIQAPYSTQQCLPQMVDWAKENRKLLVISREIIVWEVK